jgi:hypothetical protein
MQSLWLLNKWYIQLPLSFKELCLVQLKAHYYFVIKFYEVMAVIILNETTGYLSNQFIWTRHIVPDFNSSRSTNASNAYKRPPSNILT